MTTLFHGSNVDIEYPDLSKCKPGKDFGRGFYLTASRDKASRMARRTARIFGGVPRVSTFLMHPSDGLRIKIFTCADAEWAEFVYNNRESEDFAHGFDIVEGPAADDNIRYQFQRMKRDNLSFEQIPRSLEFSREDIQYCFCTAEALKTLEKI